MADLIDRAALRIDAWERLSDAVRDLAEAPTVNAVVLPCKVGDTLYVISQMRNKRLMPFINTYECTSIKIGKRKCCVYHEIDGYIRIFKEDEFGKTVFTSREEAEAALERRTNATD